MGEAEHREARRGPGADLVAGHSAGGYLAALLALDPSFLGAHGLGPGDFRGFVAVSGFYYVERIAPDRPRDVWGNDVQDWIAASPAHQAGAAEVPPLLLVYAAGDRLWRRNQHEELAAELREAGARDVETLVVTGRDHVSLWTRIGEDDGEAAARAILGFVERFGSR